MLLKENRDYNTKLPLSIVHKNLIIGVTFGLLFPLCAILFELYKLDMGYTFVAVRTIHMHNKILYIIDTAPLFLGLFAYLNGISQAKLEVTNQRLESQALVDELSGINNRRYGQWKLNEMIVSAMTVGEKIGVVFIDLDRFKAFNDNMGHWFGDQIIVAVGKRLQDGQQSGEFITRLGGDEFMLLIGHVQTIEEMHTVAERYACLFQQAFIVEDKPYIINASMGIAVFPDSGKDMETLFKNADISLYTNKRSKKNKYEFFDKAMLTEVKRSFVIEKELGGALERGEFFLVYQPIIDVCSGSISAVETLIRWKNPLLGVVPPLQFIPVAENTNLIVDIGKWVLREACLQHIRWQQQGMSPIGISVNVSVKQLHYPEFVNTVQHIIEETGLDPQYLKLEITESVSMENIIEVRKNFCELKKMNIKLSIDDFGTGYSSLSELKLLSVDELKIDKSFIDDIHVSVNSNDAQIIESIVAMAKILELQVVAEGVETVEQFSFLKSIECDHVQGYLFSKPVSAEEFMQVFQKLGGVHLG